MKALAALLQKSKLFSERYPPRSFVNPGQSPCKSVKTEKDITFSKIDMFEQTLDRNCFMTLLIDLYQKIETRMIFPDFKMFLKNWILGTFWNKISDQDLVLGIILT